VVVSLSLKVPRQELIKAAPTISEIGISTLDTLCLKQGTTSNSCGVIKTFHFSISGASKDFERSHCTCFKECSFAEALEVSQNDLLSTIKKYIRIRDDRALYPKALRNVVIVGHSPAHDLRPLKRLGVDIYRLAPVVGVLDTHIMARYQLSPGSKFMSGAAPTTSFTLGALLQRMHIPHGKSELHPPERKIPEFKQSHHCYGPLANY
jgi:hypothetical protein